MPPVGTRVETGLDVLNISFSKLSIDAVRPMLREINAMLGFQVPKSHRHYATAVMRVVAKELAYRPRNGQLSSNLLQPKKFSTICRAVAASMPSSCFKRRGVHTYRFLEGLLEFLKTAPAREAKDGYHTPSDSGIEGGVLRESDTSLPRPSIEQDVISIDSDSSEDSRSESDSSESYHGVTDVPRHSPKGKERALSTPNEDKVSSPSESEPSPTPPRKTLLKKRNPVSGIDRTVFKRERTEADTTTTDHAKKRVRDSESDLDLPVTKRPNLEHTEPADERENSLDGSPKPDELVPAPAALKKRNAYKLANEDLQAQIKFFKTMFLYGAGILETDLLTYRMRVEKMGQTHKQAWEVMTGKKNADHAARRASGGAGVGRNTSQL
jgi:hypothetical protein